MISSSTMARLGAALLVGTSLWLGGCGSAEQVGRIVLSGDSRRLRERPAGAAQSSPDRPPILFVALDGVDRDLLYDLLKKGELPHFADLLGGRSADGTLPHAHLDTTMLATLPSSTMAAWPTVLTGVAPAQHGMTGNEYFIREKLRFAAPVPVTFEDSAPTLAVVTSDEYANRLLDAPTLYERIRERDPDVCIWVAMHQIYSGADAFLIADRTAFVRAFEERVKDGVTKLSGTERRSRDLYETLDREVVKVVLDEVGDQGERVPDILTVYLSGADLYGHIAVEGPDDARRSYLREVLDPELGKLVAGLRKNGALDRRWVVVTADHGHTQVVEDEAHALSTTQKDDPPQVLVEAGFRVRPFQLDVPRDADFQAVLAYQGAMAFVYVADRSTCTEKGKPCNWERAPRYREDVLVAAEAFHSANEDGLLVPGMKGTLDLVLTREPRPWAEDDLPFQVYAGKGETVPVKQWLAEHPHPDYVAVDERLRDLAVGPHGERAGDVLLLAHNGDRAKPEDRYYFAAPYRSWHGSPSKKDSEVPFIVANPQEQRSAIAARVRAVLGEVPRQQKVTDVILSLRLGEEWAEPARTPR
jgi:hypothetical protein